MIKTERLTLLFCILGVATFVEAGPETVLGYERMVLGEMFTNTSCPTCYQADTTLNNVIRDHQGSLAVIRYHTWFPSSSDPFYRADPSENSARTNYYLVSYVPRLFLDGSGTDTSYSHWDSLVTAREDVPSMLEINLGGSYDHRTRSGQICATISAESVDPTPDLRLFFVVTEDSIYWVAPNGLRWHNQVMRDMVPSAYGDTITIRPGRTVERCQNFTLSSSWTDRNCHIVAFVQNYSTKEVLQAGLWDLPDVCVTLDPEDTTLHYLDTLAYDLNLNSNLDTVQTYYYWAEVTMPNGHPYPGNPVIRPRRVVLNPYQNVSTTVTHAVPGNAPSGEYVYAGKVGIYPSLVVDEDSFSFRVVPDTGSALMESSEDDPSRNEPVFQSAIP